MKIIFFEEEICNVNWKETAVFWQLTLHSVIHGWTCTFKNNVDCLNEDQTKYLLFYK